MTNRPFKIFAILPVQIWFVAGWFVAGLSKSAVPQPGNDPLKVVAIALTVSLDTELS
ncbi:MAG: hypothetical protein ACFE0J_18635 [Elainellaceae cyanobacterium]